MAGKGSGISHDLISLEISSPDVPDLTLIDLPGIARVAVGDQPKDIGQQVKCDYVLGSSFKSLGTGTSKNHIITGFMSAPSHVVVFFSYFSFSLTL